MTEDDKVRAGESTGAGGHARATLLSRVRIRNYKSIAECDVTLGPLALLVGPNGTGKSNFLDALALLVSAVTSGLPQATKSRNGLSEIIRRVPEPADRMSVTIDLVGRWGDDESGSERWTYGFEIAPTNNRGPLPYTVVWEECRTEGDGGASGFRAEDGMVRTFPRQTQDIQIEQGQLYLPTGSTTSKTLSRLVRVIRGMRFYNFETSALRLPRPAAKGATLGPRGEHLGDVLSDLASSYPEVKSRVDDYLAAVAPGVEAVDPLTAGRYVTVELRQRSDVGGEASFGPDAMSDGTIRAAGVLAALFQAPTRYGQVSLVGIEEPETALHPAAAGALYDALTEASEHVQVIATTQSDDLLDREDIDLESVLVTANTSGFTVIGPLDAASRQIVDDRLFTVGALMRANQLTPEPTVPEVAE